MTVLNKRLKAHISGSYSMVVHRSIYG